MAEEKSKSGLGILTFIVFAIFLTLKLAEVGVVKDWSWWWVFSPFWIYIGLMISLVILVFGWVIIKDLLFGGKKDDESESRPAKRSKFQEKLEEMARQKEENKKNKHE